jgi:hypothetical protein
MYRTANSLMLTQYEFTVERLLLAQYVRYSRQINADTIYAVQ